MNCAIETLNHWGGQFLNLAWPMLWQSSLLIVFVFALDFLLARKIRASVRYALWLAVLVKLLLPPALALPTGAAWWLFPAKPALKAPAVKHFVVTYDTVPLQTDFVPQTVPLPQPPTPKLNRAGWVLSASGAASAGLLLWLTFRWWQVARKVRTAAACEEFSKLLDDARQLAGLRSPARLKIADNRMSPAVCGLFRPVILLPHALAERLSAGQLRAVLLHELFHLRRKDVWLNCAQALLQIVYWWHPLLWFANARIRRLREEAVDDAVMLALRDEADAYAPTLLEVARLAFHRPLMSLGLVGIMESRSALRQRIERLVDFRAPRKAGLTFASLCGIFVFSAVALPMGQGPAPTEKDTSHVPAPTDFSTPAITRETNPPLVLVTAQFYDMPVDDMNKLVSNLQFKPGRADEDSWWSASPWLFQALKGELKISGLSPIMSPRVQTSSGTPAQMYVGNGTNGIEFDCTPLVNGELVNLAVHGQVVDKNERIPSTNQFRANTAALNSGGVVIRLENVGGLEASNLVAVIGVQVVTNSPARQFQQQLMPLGTTNATSALNQEQRLVRDGKLLYEMGRLDYAEIDLLQALKLDPGNDTANYYLNAIRQARISRDTIQHNADTQMRTNRVEKEWILPKTSATNRFTYSGPGRQAIVEKLARIRLDTVSYNGLTLNEVLKQLAAQSKLRDPEHKGINFLINNNPDLSGRPVTAPTGLDLSDLGSLGIGKNTGLPPPRLDPNTGLPLQSNFDAAATATNPVQQDVGSFRIKIPSLTDARLADVLDAIVLTSDHPIKYSIQDFAIVFSAKGPETPPLFMRTFRLDTNVFYTYLQKHGLLTTNDFLPAIRNFFSDLSVDLNSPPGKSVFFSYGKGMLFVKATESDLDTIERAIQVLNQSPPQIHIKARFYEVPKGTMLPNGNLHGFQKFEGASNSAGQVVGILNATNAQTAIQALQAQSRFEILAEPEATTVSGRQTQMRATQIITVVTNLTFLSSWTNENENGMVVSSNAIVPQTGKFETGPVLDVVPYVLSDGYTINLALIPSLTEFMGYHQPPIDIKTKDLPTGDTMELPTDVNLPIISPAFRVRQMVATVNLWDGQTAVLAGLPEATYVNGSVVAGDPKASDKELLVFITACIVDPTGKRVHADDELPFAQKGVPPQPTQQAQPK